MSQSGETTTRPLAEEYYDAHRFDPNVDLRTRARCPVKGCSDQPLSQLVRGRRLFPYCKIHGLELHPSSNTFVYYNGEDVESRKRARVRNFLCQQPFIDRHVLDNPNKAETDRLGHENSEDALSWNVFVSLLEARRLGVALRWLLQEHDVPVTEDPKLYLWGSQVDLSAGRFEPFELLGKARKNFEPDIKRFPTEPDIMLVTGSLLVCIEAKLTSGNPLSQETATTDVRDKPKSRGGLIERYAKRWPASLRRANILPSGSPRMLR